MVKAKTYISQCISVICGRSLLFMSVSSSPSNSQDPDQTTRDCRMFVVVVLCCFVYYMRLGIQAATGYLWRNFRDIPVSILRKSISGRHRPVRVADGPMTARCRFT